jgi:hypothetical protein
MCTRVTGTVKIKKLSPAERAVAALKKLAKPKATKSKT